MKREKPNLNTQRGATPAHVPRPAPTETKDPTADAVILIQECWGINDPIHDIAGRYAREGFICIAPDLFRGKTTKDPQEASKLMHGFDIEDVLDTIRSAIEEAQRTYQINKLGITGCCMGGTFALRAACDINTLAAAAPFYGDIPDEQTLSRLQTPTLFIAGARDNWITPEKVSGLEEAARKHDLPVEVVSYDADHAFFNDTRPEVYNPDAAADAWRRVLAFFRERLSQ